MNTFPRVSLCLAGFCAVPFILLAGCGKGADKAATLPAAQAPATTSSDADKALAAQVHAPPLPDPSRTDPEAAAMRKRYVEWRVAQDKVANDLAVKQANQALGLDKPSPTQK